MWPFDGSDQIKNAFGKYVNKDVLDSVVNDSGLQEKHIDFVLLLLSNLDFIGKAIQIVNRQECMIESITGTFITVLVGAPTEKTNSNETRLQIVAELSKELGSNVVMLHGGCDCLVGSVGNSQRMSYTAMLPEYKAKLNRLSSLEFGEVAEV